MYVIVLLYMIILSAQTYVKFYLRAVYYFHFQNQLYVENVISDKWIDQELSQDSTCM